MCIKQNDIDTQECCEIVSNFFCRDPLVSSKWWITPNKMINGIKPWVYAVTQERASNLLKVLQSQY